jgi:hypothetical protein
VFLATSLRVLKVCLEDAISSLIFLAFVVHPLLGCSVVAGWGVVEKGVVECLLPTSATPHCSASMATWHSMSISHKNYDIHTLAHSWNCFDVCSPITYLIGAHYIKGMDVAHDKL